MYKEASGPSLSREAKSRAQLHHLRLYADPDSTSAAPKWLLEHHRSERDRNPARHSFSDGAEMLAHIANSAGVPESENEDKE